MDPRTESFLVCTICRKKLGPELAGNGSINVLSKGERSDAPSKDSDLATEIAPIGRFVHRSVTYVANDPELTGELEALKHLEAENRRPAANLRTEAEVIAKHPELREWLKESDRIADPKVTSGRAGLKRQRRFGILRSLDGEDQGFPIHQPVLNYPLPPDQGFWLLRLRDELEWLVMPVFKKTISRPYPRPTKDRLNHREARAILDWTAFCLDMWLSKRPHLVGGRIMIDGSRSVMFDTDAFVRWVFALMN